MSYPGILHKYNSSQVAFEFSPLNNKNVVILIGGMTDGLLTVEYTPGLVDALGSIGYSVVQLQMKSSFKGFGISSLSEDIQQIKELVDYLRSEQGGKREKVLLLGHSTGSQDAMSYLLKYGATVDAGILQASVSDREAFGNEMSTDELLRMNEKAYSLVCDNKPNEILDSSYANCLGEVPVTAYRWCSLMIKGGDDDYFSSDLSMESLRETFGSLRTPFLIAYSEEDEFVPDHVNKQELILKWKNCSNSEYWSQYSGLIKGASHTVRQEESQKLLYSNIIRFIDEFNLK
ncbi:hypothetical protein Kpol_1072p23 [Vanderwaltozyma polyspora DSM 70294]|uniref:Serine aminopeptidase S33 domain-containing protein n=1 Tax=Vanderwaltozyma polyspora (strain ATCC 22028 / DSM 70294 / BCRC 21397 / CBS 2163 / NBRC 10782 / NRRL Y-8283 / UCD 57-17) TaxID=436907 RepID=A7TKP1_VANPO|nr:uncharacterized protein Kpol_1072p23 [Vanderwaltozyma polyspora DSM 70294]EDO17153.1 hypothetical protein Kpol_1072p23 [Vanderwaltozyma polyspora DSM 70294]